MDDRLHDHRDHARDRDTSTDPDDHTNRHFHGQQPAERVLCFCRKHPIVLLRPFLLTGLIMATLAAGIVLLLQLPGTDAWPWRLLLVAFFLTMTVAHHGFFLRFLQYYLEIVILTNYRVIDLKKSVFIHDDKEMIDLHEIQDIKKNQDGIWANMFNYGDIVITTASTTSSMSLPDLPHPDYHLNRINEGKRHYILDRRSQKAVDSAGAGVLRSETEAPVPFPIAPNPTPSAPHHS